MRSIQDFSFYFISFGDCIFPSSPDWLGRCLVYLSMTDEALAREDPWIKQEYMENLVFRKEFYTNVLPDAPVVENLDFRGMLFSIY